jgi:purine nucleosidase
VTVPIYIDTDLGTDVDDALALALAARDPRFDLRGLATVNGPVHERAAQVRGWLELCGRDDVPVGIGWSDPIAGGNARMPVGLVADGPVGSLPVDAPTSEQLLVSVLEAANEAVHVCVIGAMTNIARDLAKHPELFDRVAALHVMAGDVGATPIPEFNLNGDADASRAVHALPLPIVLAPYDLTARLCLTDDDIAAIGAAGALGAELERQMRRWTKFLEGVGVNPADARVRLHDPLSVLDVVDDAVATKQTMQLALQGDAGSLFYVESAHGRPVTVMRDADEARLRAAIVDVIKPT